MGPLPVGTTTSSHRVILSLSRIHIAQRRLDILQCIYVIRKHRCTKSQAPAFLNPDRTAVFEFVMGLEKARRSKISHEDLIWSGAMATRLAHIEHCVCSGHPLSVLDKYVAVATEARPAAQINLEQLQTRKMQTPVCEGIAINLAFHGDDFVPLWCMQL